MLSQLRTPFQPVRSAAGLFMAICIAAATFDAAYAQPYPNKSLRIITGTAGGGTDLASRLIAEGLTASLGQQVIIDNRGGGGIIAGPLLAKSAPDGYTLLLYGSTIWLTPLMRNDASYDVKRDFAPITMAVTAPSVLVVHPSVHATSVKELIALAKAKPGELNYASTGTGSANHLAAELFKSMAGVNFVRINYKGTAPATNDVLAGQVQLIFGNPVAALPFIKQGRLRVLGITSAQRSALMPDAPTIASAGLPGYESGSKQGVFAPAKTPAPITRRLNQEIVRVLNHPDSKEKLLRNGVEVVANSPEQFLAMVQSELIKMGKVIKEAGIREN